MRRAKGFTLIELLIAATLLSLLSAAVFAVFSKGLALEKRSRDAGIYEKEAWITADGIAREFRNGTAFPGVLFDGRATALSFMTVLRPGSVQTAEIGVVQYGYDPGQHALFRREYPYFELFRDKNEAGSAPPLRPVLTDVEAFSVHYYTFNKAAMKLEWTDSWNSKDAFPLGLRVDIALGAAHKGKQVTKTVYVTFPR